MESKRALVPTMWLLAAALVPFSCCFWTQSSLHARVDVLERGFRQRADLLRSHAEALEALEAAMAVPGRNALGTESREMVTRTAESDEEASAAYYGYQEQGDAGYHGQRDIEVGHDDRRAVNAGWGNQAGCIPPQFRKAKHVKIWSHDWNREVRGVVASIDETFCKIAVKIGFLSTGLKWEQPDSITVIDAEEISFLPTHRILQQAKQSWDLSHEVWSTEEDKKEMIASDISSLLGKHGWSIDMPDFKGWTPLMFAAAEGSEDVVEVLLELRADPHRTSSDGRTALLHAALSGKKDTAEVLHRYKANVDQHISKDGRDISVLEMLTLKMNKTEGNMDQRDMDRYIDIAEALIHNLGAEVTSEFARSVVENARHFPSDLVDLIASENAFQLIASGPAGCKIVAEPVHHKNLNFPLGNCAFFEWYRRSPSVLERRNAAKHTVLIDFIDKCPDDEDDLIGRFLLHYRPLSVRDCRDDGMTAAMMAAEDGKIRFAQHLRSYMAAVDGEDGEEHTGIFRVSDYALCFVMFLLLKVVLVAWVSDPKHTMAAKRMSARFAVMTIVNISAVYCLPVLKALTGDDRQLESISLILRTEWNVVPDAVFPTLGVILLIGWCLFVYADFQEACGKLDKQQARGMADPVTHDADCCGPIKVTDIFQDPMAPLPQCLLTFIFIICLTVFYFNELWKPVLMSAKNRFFWALATLLQMYLTNKDLGKHRATDLSLAPILPGPLRALLDWASPPGTKGSLLAGMVRWTFRMDECHNEQLWRAVFARRILSDVGSGVEVEPPSRREAYARFLMSYVINGLLPALIIYTIPLFLASKSNTMEFVVDSFAITYLSDLDDADAEYVQAPVRSQVQSESGEVRESPPGRS